MPELPEVETLKRELARVLPGRVVKSVKITWPKTVAPLTPRQFAIRLHGRIITAVSRRAKILLISLTPGQLILAIHLKMTGQLIYYPQGSTLKPAKVEPLIIGGHPQARPFRYTRVIFNFTDGSRLYFNDLRKFGWLKILPAREARQIHEQHGLEPLSANFTLKNFAAALKRY